MLWIVGRTFSELEAYLQAQGIIFGLLRDQRFPNQKTAAQRVVDIDFASETTAAASLIGTDLAAEGFLLSGYEEYVRWAAWLGKRYHLPAPSDGAAEAATNKLVMRTAFWRSSDSIAPAWQAVTSEVDLAVFASKRRYPLVLKPLNLSKSRFVSINRDWASLRRNFNGAKQSLGERGSALLAEDFMTGSMHTVAGFVDSRGNITLSSAIVDCERAIDRGVDDSYIAERSLPSKISTADAERMLAVARTGVQTLKLRSVGLHIELILTKDGPQIIEIAARLGGYRPHMYLHATGEDLYQNLINISRGDRAVLRASKQAYCTVVEVFPEQSGVVTAIQGIDKLRTMPGVESIKIKKDIGAEVGHAKDGFKAAIIVTLSADNKQAVTAARDYIRSSVRVLTSDASQPAKTQNK